MTSGIIGFIGNVKALLSLKVNLDEQSNQPISSTARWAPHMSEPYFDLSSLTEETFSSNMTLNDTSICTSYLSYTEMSRDESHDQSDTGQSHNTRNSQDSDSQDIFKELS